MHYSEIINVDTRKKRTMHGIGATATLGKKAKKRKRKKVKGSQAGSRYATDVEQTFSSLVS